MSNLHSDAYRIDPAHGEIIVGLAIFILLLNANAPVLFLLMGVMIVCIKILDAVQAKDLTKTGRLANFHGANILRSIQEIFDGFREMRVYRKEAQFQSYLLGAVNGYARLTNKTECRVFTAQICVRDSNSYSFKFSASLLGYFSF